MPRLLLVDDNPSIHRIAESLLAPTDIELTCADSAADALDRLERGERFDVALVDTAMPGMDGWTLLARLRAMDATAQMPIALMAGVLDPVDPAKLAKAPVQGFLKKPIELRELGDRVKALLATPVVHDPSPFSTLPATPVQDLIRRAEVGLPEYRPNFSAEVPAVEPVEVAPALTPEVVEPDLDLLILGEDDLWPEVSVALPAPIVEAPSDVQLELEELDLESLQDLTEEPRPELPLEPVSEPMVDLMSELDLAAVEVEALPSADTVEFPDFPEDDALVAISGLDDLDVLGTGVPEVPSFVPEPEPVLEAAPVIESMELEDDVLDLLSALPVPVAVGGQIPAAEGQPVSAVMPEFTPTEAAPVLGTGNPSPTQVQAQALLQALLAEPVLMDALIKALVARMGDQVLREIAWEVMPDLAGRLQR